MSFKEKVYILQTKTDYKSTSSSGEQKGQYGPVIYLVTDKGSLGTVKLIQKDETISYSFSPLIK